MTQSEWIVCERSGRWAAALRVQVMRSAKFARRKQRIYEVRSFDELAERLALRPHSLALVEGTAKNLGRLLRWLTDNARLFPQACFVVVLDQALGVPANSNRKLSPDESYGVEGAMLEAGAAEVAFSPRHLQHIFVLAAKHATVVAEAERPSRDARSIADWAWSLVPWQADPV
jgi:hypothetical protein